MNKARVAILISGRGSNMSALIEAARDPDYPARIVGVLSDRDDAKGLEIAAAAGIATRAITRAEHPDRAAHEAALVAALAEIDAEIICLAGYMRLLSDSFVDRWRDRMLNIHPSLLPLFKGLHPHRQALEAGVRIHGCTVHFVTAETDAGPIVAQTAVPVLPGDSEETLAARVLDAEHRLYPLALRIVADGGARVEDGRVAFRVMPEGDAPVLDTSIESLARMTP